VREWRYKIVYQNFILDFGELVGMHSLSGEDPIDKFEQLINKTSSTLSEIKKFPKSQIVKIIFI
jgi:hypothetical protein